MSDEEGYIEESEAIAKDFGGNEKGLHDGNTDGELCQVQAVAHPAAEEADIWQRCTSDEEGDIEESEATASDCEGNEKGLDDRNADGKDYQVQAVECHATCTRHDDWLHRGPFLADLPWHAYMMRVRRARKPSQRGADYSEYFFF